MTSDAHTALDEMKEGAFVRSASGWRDIVSAEHPIFKPAAGRYHLYVAHACPWATRCLAVLQMKGLADAISVSIVHPTWKRTRPDNPQDTHCGWFFSDNGVVETNPAGTGKLVATGLIPDTVNGCKFVRDLYELAKDTHGKYSVPILWDKETKTIVNNESAEIVRMLNSTFNEFATNPALDLYPAALQAEIESVNSWVYDYVNNGVYKCGFAKTQEAYDESVKMLFDHLAKVEDILSKRRYMAGPALTEADLRLFMTLARFDEVYVVYFKCNKATMTDYPNIRNWRREMWQTPGVGSSIHMENVKMHYFTAHPMLNIHAVVPVGPNSVGDMESAHDRARFAA